MQVILGPNSTWRCVQPLYSAGLVRGHCVPSAVLHSSGAMGVNGMFGNPQSVPMTLRTAPACVALPSLWWQREGATKHHEQKEFPALPGSTELRPALALHAPGRHWDSAPIPSKADGGAHAWCLIVLVAVLRGHGFPSVTLHGHQLLLWNMWWRHILPTSPVTFQDLKSGCPSFADTHGYLPIAYVTQSRLLPLQSVAPRLIGATTPPNLLNPT